MDVKKFLRAPEDFQVKEIVDKRLLRKFSHSAAVRRIEGPYTLYELKKRDMNTRSAITQIARQLGVPELAIGYAGLKDKFAVTTQYVTIKGSYASVRNDSLSLIAIGKTNRHIAVGDLEGNEFAITLHGKFAAKKIEKNAKIIAEKGFPNYFGPQRFGSRKNNHVIGKLIVERKFSEALQLINESHKYSDLRHVRKDALKFFVHAYQSYVFNSELSRMMKNGKVPAQIAIPGRGTDERFAIRELRLSCAGYSRKTFVKAKIAYEVRPSYLALRFALPKGSYATALISCLLKQ